MLFLHINQTVKDSGVNELCSRERFTKTVLLHHAGANRFVRETGSDKEYAALILRFIGLQYIGIELLFCLSVFN